MKRINILLISVRMIILALLFVLPSHPSKSDGNEYSIKALFLVNFIKYVEWPDNEQVKVYHIGVVGNSAIYDALLTAVSRQQNLSYKLTVEYVTDDNLSQIDVLFIPRQQSGLIEHYVTATAGKGVLVISEENGKSAKPAAINLRTAGNRIRFDLNQSSARASGIRISSRLAELADVVNP